MADCRSSLPDWYPTDWAFAPAYAPILPQTTQTLDEEPGECNPRPRQEPTTALETARADSTAGASSSPKPPSSEIDGPGDESIPLESVPLSDFVHLPETVMIVEPDPERTVKRRLRGIHLFMITINGTLGTGLYWRGGQILELGGPLAVLLSFLLVGFLAWSVMQCITEMLCIWPIPGAMPVYVSEFVDEELGIAVGIAYWYTYSVSFAALIATAAAEIEFWTQSKGIEGGIIFLLIPMLLILFNAFGIEAYGFIEVVSGTLKLAFFAVIVVALFAILGGAGPNSPPGNQYWNHVAPFDDKAAPNWFVAFLISLSTAEFAYVGVEIVAASALEARWPKVRSKSEEGELLQRSRPETMIGNTIRFSAIWISVFATIAYSLGGLLASFTIEWDNCALPRLSWVSDANCMGSNSTTSSAFVAIAQQSRIAGLPTAFNAFLIFTALTCANTNLYVASRSLFGLTSRLDGGHGQPWYLRFLAWFGKTNRLKVPMRSMVMSALMFWWVPFLQLADKGGISDSNTIGVVSLISSPQGRVH